MAYIETTNPHDAKGLLQQMYARQKANYGYVPNYAQAFTPRPEILDLWAKLLNGISENLDPRLFELVTLSAALALKSSYCALAHGTQLLDFFTPDQIVALTEGQYAGIVTPAEEVAMGYARAIAEDASSIDQHQVQRVTDAGFADEEVFDIAAAASARAFFTKLLDGLGAVPDCEYAELDPDLQQALAVGRPIEAPLA
jgi:alkylhydroperoxidase family enzyme